jgi:hypothetical protein
MGTILPQGDTAAAAESAVAVARATSTSRFSDRTRALFKDLGREFITLTDRHHHVKSTHAELARIARGKPFAIHHRGVWRMVLAERDMVIVRAASWIKGFYSPGGFLRKVQAGELRALALRWEKGQPGAWRSEAFRRLFPMAAGRGIPNGSDIDALVLSLRAEFRPLVQDRHEHRAHPFENESTGTVKRLDLTEVAEHLNRIHRLLGDLHCLAAANHFTDWDASPDADSDARDVVDLILCGPLGWIVDEVDARSRQEPNAKPRYVQRREAHYERLHAAHDAKGAPDEPFNTNAFQVA